MEALTILVSIGALLVSGGSLWVAIASFRKNSRTSKRLLEIETDREIDRKREKGKKKPRRFGGAFLLRLLLISSWPARPSSCPRGRSA